MIELRLLARQLRRASAEQWRDSDDAICTTLDLVADCIDMTLDTADQLAKDNEHE
jgi:hypothetical protein